MRITLSSVFPAGSGEDLIKTSPPRGTFRAGVIAGLICLVVYMLNFRSISAGDTYPARYLPFAIWHWHTVLLDPVEEITAQGWTPIKPRKDKEPPKSVDPEEAFWAVQISGGHAVSLYPIVVPVLLSPLYLPAVVYLSATGWNPLQLDRVARIMEKGSASLVTAVSAALFYLLLRRFINLRTALLLTFAYSFGTTTWMISSQALWQHGAGELLVVSALLLLTGKCTAARTIAAGFFLGLIACNRPPDTIIAAALGIYGLRWALRFAPAMIAAAMVPVALVLFYNLGVVGHYAGAYGLVGDPSFFQHNPLTGLAGLLFSPTKGLFVFSPFLLFVPFCLPRIFRDANTRGIALAALTAVVLQLVLYSAADWRQGGSWGPRWLTDLLPLLIWLMAPGVMALSRYARGVFVAAVGAAIVIEVIGAFWYTGASNAAVYASAKEANPMRSAWEVRNAPFLAELRHARAPFALTTDVRGFVDAMTIDYGRDGREIGLDGWALAGERAPSEIAVLRDGHPVTSTSAFGPRPDVVSTLGAKGPSGWHVIVPISHLSPGEHVVAILARPFTGADIHLLAERRFEVPAQPGFAYLARLAANTLAARQQPLGYWLTSFTNQRRFEHPGVEMNTYLPAVMTDILRPVATVGGLKPILDRAAHFLTEQIEGSGLVRYHGLPNAPTIGTLGCVITPDADDTALAWRVAPSAHRELLPSALAKIAAFRTPGGLYRTWLAPKASYDCIDPGSDPDPADIAIQMHVLLFLEKEDPPAAKALCAALKRSVDEDRVWVYYKSAPLMPILRQADLRAAGCLLRVPLPRQQTAVNGQEIWLSAARMLDREHGETPPSPEEVHQWLQTISEDDFAYLRRSPPLLYHNDLTASVPRFYWSEDFGYALWLRLYFDFVVGGAH